MKQETIRFHKGLRAVVLPDGRRVSSDRKRVFVESSPTGQPSVAVGQQRPSRIDPAAAAQALRRSESSGAPSVPVGPPSASSPMPSNQAAAVPNNAPPPKSEREAALEEALRTLKERVEPLLKKISGQVNEFATAQKAQLQQLEQPTLEIAMCIAEHVVGHCVDSKQLSIQPLIANALKRLADPSEARIKVNTHDLAALNAAGVDLDSLGAHVSIVADRSLPAGSCVVESAGHQMASTIRQRLDNARRFVMEEFQNGRD